MPADSVTDMPIAPVQIADDDALAKSAWIETALTVLFTATAVLFVSFLAVVTGLV